MVRSLVTRAIAVAEAGLGERIPRSRIGCTHADIKTVLRALRVSARWHLPVHEVAAPGQADAGVTPASEAGELGAAGIGEVVLALGSHAEKGGVGVLETDAGDPAPAIERLARYGER